jgi:hypothetical protein
VRAAQEAAASDRSQANLENLSNALHQAATAQRELGEAHEAATPGIERMEHTMARMAGHMAFEAVPGMSRMGRLIEMLGVQAAGVAPVLATLAPVAAIAAGVMIFDAYEESLDRVAKAQLELKESEDKQLDELYMLSEQYAGVAEGPVAKFRKEIEDLPKKHAILNDAIKDSNTVLEIEGHWYDTLADRIHTAAIRAAEFGLLITGYAGSWADAKKAVGDVGVEKSTKEVQTWIKQWVTAHDSVDKMRTGLGDLREEMDKIASGGGARAKVEIDMISAAYEDAQRKIGADEEKRRIKEKEGREAGAKAEEKAGEAELEAAKKVRDQAIASDEEVLKQRLKLGELSAADEAKQREELNKRKLASDVEYLSAKMALELKAAKPEERPAIEAKYKGLFDVDQMKFDQAAAAGQAEMMADIVARIRAMNEEKISANKSTQEIILATDESAAKRDLDLGKVSASEYAAMLLSFADRRTEIQRKALEYQLEIAKAKGEQGVVEAARIQDELTALTLKGALERAKADEEGLKLVLERQSRLFEEQVDAARKAADEQLEISKITAAPATVKGLTDYSAQKAALDSWLVERMAADQQAVDFAASRYGMDSIQYEQALERKHEDYERYVKEVDELDRRRVDAVRGFASQMTGIWASNINQWIAGHERLRQVWANSWYQMAVSALQTLVKIGEQWVMTHLIMRAASAVFHLSEQTAQTIDVATKTASNVAMAMSDAALAAAGQFAYYSAIAPPIAPAMAAAAYAQGMVWAGAAGAEEGGMIGETGLAMLHKGEIVMPPAVSNVFRNMTENNAFGAPSMTFAPAIHAMDATGVARVLRQHQSEFARVGMRLWRNNVRVRR